MRRDVGFLESMGGAREWGWLWGGVLLGCIVPFEPLWGQSEGITGGRKGEDETLDGSGAFQPPDEPSLCFREP